MKARPLIRALPAVGVIIAMAGFILGPATPASAAVGGPHSLTVTNPGSGIGNVISIPNGISFPGDPVGSYTGVPAISEPVVTLTANPAFNSFFAGWSDVSGTPALGAGCGNLAGSCTLTLDEDTVISATFNHLGFPGPFINGPGTLSVVKTGTGTGTVTSTDGLISCGADCAQGYGALMQVTLLATPGPNSSFAGWNVSGYASNLAGCGGTGACTLQLNNWNGFGWNGVNWNGFGWNGFDWNTLVTATFNAVSPVAAASVTRVSHTHQHGGIVTGAWHHGLRHLKKHTHTHSHVAII
jgi:hypothetical protein